MVPLLASRSAWSSLASVWEVSSAHPLRVPCSWAETDSADRSNIAPLIAEQYKETKLFIKTIPKTGERVIVDPSQTLTRIFLYFYFMINVGALIGSIAMVYAEKYVGFWLSFLLPTIMFCFCPIVLFLCRNKYDVTPPTGSVLVKALKLWRLALRGRWSWNPVKL